MRRVKVEPKLVSTPGDVTPAVLQVMEDNSYIAKGNGELVGRIAGPSKAREMLGLAA